MLPAPVNDQPERDTLLIFILPLYSIQFRNPRKNIPASNVQK